VVLVGDLNSQPDDTAGAYGTFAAAGYVDAWVVVHGPEGGFTAGQTELLDNVPSKLDHRIDFVLYQPRGIHAVAAEVLGEELDDRTPTGLWPSDHAGVVATLHLAHP
jgi:endonuclease/exonuclease/phosphatase family metal-dependent hydrolase